MSVRLLSLAAGTILDVDPATAVSVAAQAGFGAVGIWFDPATWSDRVAAGVVSRINDEGIIVLDIEPIMLTPAGSSSPDSGEAIVDAALAIGARNILVASRDTDEARVAARLHELALRLEGSSIRLVLEFLPVLGIRTLPQARRIVANADHPALGVLIDNLHLARAGHTPAHVSAVDRALLPYLQICDAPALPAETPMSALLHEALHGRLLPGEGVLPITELLEHVPDVPLSFELRSETLMAKYPDPGERAAALMAAVRHL
jgi:sugar phosphate isomerase/epimerase